MTSLRARRAPTQPHGAHVSVQVFAGPDPDHRAMCGSLVMRPEEADALIAALAAPDAPPDAPPAADVDQAAATTAYLALENQLVELRDERISMPLAGNGLVIREADGTPSSIIRIHTSDAATLAARIYQRALAVPACRHGMRPLPDVPCPACTRPSEKTP